MNKKSSFLQVWDLGRQPYQPVWELQRRLQQQRIKGEIPDTLLLLEHPPIYTIGKTGSSKDVIASGDFLQTRGIKVLEVDRGGQVTYHGPGQLVGYPIINLKDHKASISWYIDSLEEVFIQTLLKWEIRARRIEKLRGVWVRDEKITALGVRMKRWVTMHGFAFNIDPDLEAFSGIIPCGISDRGVTSLARLLPSPPTFEEARAKVVETFGQIFSFDDLLYVEKEVPSLASIENT